MRVLWLIDSLGPGGAESLMLPLLKSLQNRVEDPRVCVLYERAGNPTAVELEKIGIPVDLVPVRNLRDAAHIGRLFAYLRQQRPDILHTQLETSDILGSLFARLLGIPSLSTMHTLDARPEKVKQRLRFGLRWWCLNHLSRRVIAVSEFTRQHYLGMGFKKAQLLTLYNGIDASLFVKNGAARPSKAQLFGLPAESLVFSTVAVLREPKGIQHMLRALPDLLAKEPRIYYVIVGDGEHRGALERLASSLGIASRVVFLGHRKDIPNILAASDFFVYPTLQDALPTALLEAMAAGVPIVASRVDGVPEILEDEATGLLVPPGDPDRLAEACGRLLDDAALAGRLTAAARETIRERFEINRQAGVILALYEKILSGEER